MVMQTGDMSDGDFPLFALSRREGNDKVSVDRPPPDPLFD
jgi:hypothetical protein